MTRRSTAARPDPQAPSQDVCVVTYRSEETIGDLLASVERHLPAARIRICDNSPDTQTLLAVRAATPPGSEIDVLSPQRNLGFGRGCNALAERSTAEWLIFLNPDAAITEFSCELAGIPPRTAVGAVIHDQHGNLQATFGPERTMAQEVKLRLFRLKPPADVHPEPFETALVSGAALAIRRADFVALGGFDAERYFMYYEDIDLCRRLRESGGRVVVDPRWRVTHIGGHSARRTHDVALINSYQSAATYHRRWSRSWWLFRPVCAVEAFLKVLLSLPRGRIGETTSNTQWRLLCFLIGWRRP